MTCRARRWVVVLRNLLFATQEEKDVSSSLAPLLGLAAVSTAALGGLAYVTTSGSNAFAPLERLTGGRNAASATQLRL